MCITRPRRCAAFVAKAAAAREDATRKRVEAEAKVKAEMDAKAEADAAAKPVTFSVNIGSTELERCTMSDYKADRYNCKSRCSQFRIDQLSCKKVNSKTITVTPVFDQKIELPYGTTIKCPKVVNKANWLSGETHGDTFGITVAGNKITAQRTDKRDSWGFIKPTEWGIDLKFECTASPTTAAEDAANKKDAALAEAAKKKDAALAECQKMPENAWNAWGLEQFAKASYGTMKKKKNCFKNLAGPRKSAAFQACRKIKPNGKSYDKMKNKKDCFRDLAFSDPLLRLLSLP